MPAGAFLAFAIAGCGGGDGGGGPDGGTPTSIEAVGSVAPATVNAVIAPSPSVKVTDASGRAVSNVAVSFTANGGGTITGGEQRTNAQGLATVGSWRLGTVAGGGNSLVATAGSLTTTISAVANAGPASVHARAPGQPESQAVAVSTAVPVKPAVIVTDQYGNPVQGVIVTFAPSANSGTVTGGLKTTSAAGIATVDSWTVGSSNGTQTLIANTNGLAPVTFTANVGGGGSPCDPKPYTFGSSMSGTLAAGDCQLGDGSLIDLYRATTTAAVNHEIRMTSTAFNAYLLFISANDEILGIADDESSTSSNARLHVMAPPGTYQIGANAFAPGQTGAYTLTTTATGVPAGCTFDTYVVEGASFAESIAATDCDELTGAGTTGKGDEYAIAVYPGHAVTVTQRSSAIDSYLRLYRVSGNTLIAVTTDNNSAGGNDARVSMSVAAAASAGELFVIVATTAAPGATGAYTLEFATTTAPPPFLAAARSARTTNVLSLEQTKVQAASWRAAMAARRAHKLDP